MSDYDVPHVLHTPLAPPRCGVPGEEIYLALWREFASARPLEWKAIFRTTGPIRQRAASVAASFMVFMGCNGGNSFTHEAERFAKEPFFVSRERAFLAAWAIYNSRSRGVNCGLRTSEFMLAKTHPVTRPFGGGQINWKNVPNITQDDNDILESMVVWWSTEPASVIRSIAEPMIEAATRKAMSELFGVKGGA